MEAKKTSLAGVFELTHYSFEDHRGTYEQLYETVAYNKAIKGLISNDIKFLEDDFATSSKNVLRGIHGDNRTWKLMTCLYGKCYVVIVHCDMNSSSFGKWQSFILSHENKRQLLVAPTYGNSYLVLSDYVVFHYKQSCIYQGIEKQFTYKYNDSRFGIFWPTKNPILSERDSRVL